MPHEIRVPRLGWSMEEGTFIRWLKNEGDEVRRGEPLYELEGEKALQEVESIDAGTLRISPQCPESGMTVAVGALLGCLAGVGEKPPWEQEGALVPGTIGTTTNTPAHLAAATQSLHDSGSVATAPPTNGAASSRQISTPRARRVATELGIDWKSLKGTGRGGRIRESDIRKAAAGIAPTSAADVERAGTRVRMSPRRRAIAERMLQSQQRNAPVTLTTSIDATELVRQRNEMKASGPAGLVASYTDLAAAVVARVLRQHRALAGCWDAARENIIFPHNDGIHIGIAVHTEEGLLVPVIRNAGTLAVKDLVAQSRALIDKARSGSLAAAEMQGGVFTVTSLGADGVDAFTPIINDPEAAILGLGAIRRIPVVLPDDRIVPRDTMTLSLTFDHCRIDGAPAARFLQAVCTAMENPSAVLA